MPCNPSDNTLNPIVLPGIPIPGFPSPPASPINIPIPGFNLPTSLVEDLLALVDKLKIQWPSGILQPNIDGFTKTILDGVVALFNQIAPFLSLYKLITAALNMIICIIEVLCAIPNPFAVAKKLIKLFTECLPPFLAIFPYAALIIMILSILLLVIALIEYLIETVLGIIEDLLSNFKKISSAITLHNAASVDAITLKIGNLLCDIQNLFAVLVALGAIFAIIQALAAMAGGPICGSGDGEGCCGPETCPPFISNNPDGISGSFGTMKYMKQVGTDIAQIFSDAGLPGIPPAYFNLAPLRAESWQFWDSRFSPPYPFSDIIVPTPISGNIFYPEGKVFSATSAIKHVPYTIDLRVSLDPIIFHSSDFKGNRFFKIKDCVIIQKPYIGVFNFQSSLSPIPFTGTLSLQGGLVFEDDGTTPYIVSGKQATLNTFIHSNKVTVIPGIDDSVIFQNIEYTLKPNHPILAGEGLITFGCIPAIAQAKGIQNAVILAEDPQAVDQKLPANNNGSILPDVSGTQSCLDKALQKFKSNITTETIATFQAETVACLNNLKSQSLSTYCTAIQVAVSQFKTTASLSITTQFLARPIIISVILKDSSNSILSNNIPISCVPVLEKLLTTETTFGSVGGFVYDGTLKFLAPITSKIIGGGEIKVLFNQKVISQLIINPIDNSSILQEVVLPFNFIDPTYTAVIRHDFTDISES